MSSNLSKDIFVFSVDDLFKDAQEATEMNKVLNNLVKYFNSKEVIIESYLETNNNYSDFMNRVVECEVD